MREPIYGPTPPRPEEIERAARELVEAIENAPSPLTASEVALAKILAAWEEWPGARHDETPEAEAVKEIGGVLLYRGWVDEGDRCSGLSPAGRALLDRARKAGVL